MPQRCFRHLIRMTLLVLHDEALIGSHHSELGKLFVEKTPMDSQPASGVRLVAVRRL